MNRLAMTPWFVVAVALSLANAQGKEETVPAALEESAHRFVDLLAAGDFAGATGQFDETMTRVMPPEELAKAWMAVQAAAGPFQRKIAVSFEKKDAFQIVLVTCQFEKGRLDVKLVYDARNHVSGLWFAPSSFAEDYRPPGYATPESFQEREVQVGTEPWVLPGTLTLPRGDGPFAAVVLVHGSGPNDRDETVGPNKPFRDLACGLGSRSIAVLRYEKRTREHGARLAADRNSLTVKEETVDDALAAVSLLRESEGVDPRSIFVLGHSLGGMLVPRIGSRDRRIAGFIVFAGTSRPFENVILEQYSYFFALDSEISPSEQEELDQLKAQVARVKDPELSAATPAAELPLGIPANYWLDLRDYDPAREARSLQRPLLILQGERDYQVTIDDFKGWRRALSSRKNVEFKLYPKLNHLFIEGEGKCTPAEYGRPGHVAETVIDDIADWLGRHRNATRSDGSRRPRLRD